MANYSLPVIGDYSYLTLPLAIHKSSSKIDT